MLARTLFTSTKLGTNPATLSQQCKGNQWFRLAKAGPTRDTPYPYILHAMEAHQNRYHFQSNSEGTQSQRAKNFR